jgi:saccharopine dehydrogenase-like NADP-dependent oxidoreductase
MKKITLLGCGLVGSVIARDLAADEHVTVLATDASESSLRRLEGLPRIEVRQADLSSANAIREVVASADAVVGAVPGWMGFEMLRTVIEAGKPISDISFAPENTLELDGLAKQHGVTAVVDCGVSPGLSNLAIGRAVHQLTEAGRAVIYVGGLPAERYWPFEYRSVFSPTDVIEEYTRPARLREAGQVVVREALTEVELLDFAGIGTLEAFNTDGLRTLLDTIDVPWMKEKTLRYPGHVDRMRMLREMGLFSDEPVTVDGTEVIPRRLTEKLMFGMWSRPEKEPELTVLRVVVDGRDAEGRSRAYQYDLIDRTDPATGMTSMARTTGFPCAIMARMLADGTYADPGVRPMELFASNDTVYNRLLAELDSRGVALVEQVRST